MLEKQAFHTFIKKQALSARDFIRDPNFTPPQGLTQHLVSGMGGVSARGIQAGGEGLKRFSTNSLRGPLSQGMYGGVKPLAQAASAAAPAAGAAAGAAGKGISSMMSGALGKLKWPLAGLGALGAYKLMTAPSQHQDFMQSTGGMPYVGQ